MIAEIPYWAQSLLRVLGGTVAVLLPAGTVVYLYLFKMMSFMQSRLGPMEAGPYGSMQLVAVGLAGQFCSKLVSNEVGMATGSRKFFNLIDFSGAATAITTAAQVDVTNRLFRNFLKRDPSADEVLIIKDAFADAAATAVGSDRSPARSALVACTSVLGSAEFLGNN